MTELKTHNPFFSIIIPTFNSEKTINYCIESVLSQTFSNFEILIIDGASKDQTVNLTKSFGDSRIKIISEPDQGIYDAMNKGIINSSGQWLYFLGSDDTLYDTIVLTDIYTAVQNWGLDVIYGDVFMMKSGVINDGEFDFKKIQTNPICHQAIFYKREIFNVFGNYNLKYKVYADADFNLKWFFSKKHKYRYLTRLIANYAETGFSSVQTDVIFYDELPEKLLKLGWKYLDSCDLKVHAKYALINNKKKGLYLKYIYYNITFNYLRVVDIINRKLNI